MEIKRRLPLGGVAAERSRELLVLLVCVMWVCAGVYASVRAELMRARRIVTVSGEGVTKRTSAMDGSAEMGGPIGVVDGGDSV